MVVLRQLTPKGRHRGKGGSPISSSLPRHGARERIEKQKQNKKKTEKLRTNCKFAQKR